MNQQEKTKRLKELLEKLSPGIYDNRIGGLEGMATSDQEFSGLESGLEMLANNRTLAPDDSFGLEAIVHKKFRPAVFIVNDTFDEPPDPWTHLGRGEARTHLERVIPSIGRIELPGSGIPYGGTGFVVGDGLIMTNRHVADIFTRGLGTRSLRFKSGMTAGINFRKEVLPSPHVKDLTVTAVKMIHPYWDMALLQVEGLEENHPWLALSTSHTDDLIGRDIAVIGYPAQDPRNDVDLQNEIFGGVYNVKRMQPGKLDPRARILSFGQQVNAMTHDASTLGGNSGSAVVDVQNGQILALHFAGIYLKANYAVPTFELARDQRVVDAGVSFDGSAPAGTDWADRWALADTISESTSHPISTTGVQSVSAVSGQANVNAQVGANGEITVTIPLTVTVSLGQPTGGGLVTSVTATTSNTTSGSASESAELEGLFGSNKEALIHSAYHQADVSTIRQSNFSPQAALTCAAASELAYSDDAAHIEAICKHELGFSTCKFLRKDQTECFVATSADTVMVSFRGTAGVRDWITDMNIFEQATDFGMVHGGFLQGFLDISRDIEAEIDAVLNGQQLVLTGHSLGGALATVAASEWRRKYDIRSIFTFGQPAVGDRVFRDNMDEFKSSFHRVVNDDDIVTRIPPPYRHVGTRIKLPSNREIGNIGTESMSAMETDSEEMVSEAAFHQLQAQLDTSNQSVGTEGFLPSFSDHKIANYIGKLLKLSRVA